MQKKIKFNLKSFLILFEDKAIAKQFFEPYYILGFITAAASAPELIKFSEWLPMLLRDDERTITSDKQMIEFNHSVTAWWNECNHKFFHQEELFLPETLSFTQSEGVSIELKDFASGYLNGYDWLSDVWDDVIDKELQESELEQEEEPFSELSALIGMATMTLLQCTIHPKKLTVADDVPDFVEEISAKGDLVKFLGHVLSDIGENGHALAQASEELRLSQAAKIHEPFVDPQRVIEPDESCPCGSGKKYKKCCLH